MQKFAIPKDGVKIRRPDSGEFLAESGENVPYDTFWRRREIEGDITFSDERLPADYKPPEAAPPPSPPKIQAVPQPGPADANDTVAAAPAAGNGGSK